MKRFNLVTIYPLHLRGFNVCICDERTGEIGEDVIVFTRQQLQAAQMARKSILRGNIQGSPY